MVQTSSGLYCCQADLDAHQKAGASQHAGELGMNEDLIIHGEPFTEHKSTFQVSRYAERQPVTFYKEWRLCDIQAVFVPCAAGLAPMLNICLVE